MKKSNVIDITADILCKVIRMTSHCQIRFPIKEPSILIVITTSFQLFNVGIRRSQKILVEDHLLYLQNIHTFTKNIISTD